MALLKEKKEAGKPTGTRPPCCDGPTLPTKGASHQPGTTGTICRCWASGSVHPCNIGQKRASWRHAPGWQRFFEVRRRKPFSSPTAPTITRATPTPPLFTTAAWTSPKLTNKAKVGSRKKAPSLPKPRAAGGGGRATPPRRRSPSEGRPPFQQRREETALGRGPAARAAEANRAAVPSRPGAGRLWKPAGTRRG